MSAIEGNRRRTSRYEVPDGTVECELQGLLFSRVGRFEGRILDLSVGGCRFLTPVGLPLRSHLWMKFLLPDAGDPVLVKGSVHHQETVEFEGTYTHVLGIQFEHLKERDAILLRHRLRSGRLGPRVSPRRKE